jgi:hypothetical protein
MRTPILAAVLVALAACSSPPPPGAALDVATVAGSWRGDHVKLDIDPTGTVHYERTGTTSSKLSGLSLSNLSSTGFDVGVGMLSTHFVINAVPATTGSTTTMTVDGAVLTKQSAVDAALEAAPPVEAPAPVPAAPPATLPTAGTLEALVGSWVGGEMTLRIAPDGTLNYRRGGTSINGVQVQNVTAAGFEAGVFGLTTKFVVSAPAAVVDGKVQMTVDGVVLTKVVDG